MRIQLSENTQTLAYAAEELKKYLSRMDSTLSFDSGEALLLQVRAYPDIDPMIDDIMDIQVTNLSGTIAGSNERSVLMGVYTLLKAAGCMWVRPGVLGEYIPKKAMSCHSLTYYKKADYAFRGECIEGAPSFENLCDTIEFLPKINANLFMLEQIIPFNYISRWYDRKINTKVTPQPLSFEEISAMIPELEKRIKKCGLQLHSLGHGYLFEPYGIHYKTYADTYVLNDRARSAAAMLGGKRDFFDGSPNFTQLCMSQDWVRKDMVEYLVSYVQKKPLVDFLHVWLSDCANNHCECPDCQKKTPTDWYITILNELDARLTELGLNTKIVFIMYTDTYWAPETVKFNNPDRFILTTALTGRNYSQHYTGNRSPDPLPVYQRNNNYLSVSLPLTMSFLDSWKPTFDGRKFAFEYRFYTDHYFDPGYMSIAKTTLEDIRHLRETGLEGTMDDKTQRSYFPTGLPMAVYCEGLFDSALDFDDFADRYFEKAFGSQGHKVRQYLEEITNLFDPSELRVLESILQQDTGTGLIEKPKRKFENNPESEARFRKIAPAVEAFRKEVLSQASPEDPCHQESYRILTYHAEYCTRLGEIMIAMAQGDREKANAVFSQMVDHFSLAEDEIQPYFDLYLFHQRIRSLINP